ncbi:MAG: superoxide dismutase family protein [Candidatus Aminicenantes bacterium]
MKKLAILTVLLIFFTLSMTGCSREEPMEEIIPVEEEASATKAVAVLYPTQGNTANGVVTFTRVDNGIEIVADVQGLTPGKHGFHIHEYGDCSAQDSASAGGHFNPDHMPHGAPEDAVRHVGDLGNLTADAEGKAHYERVDSLISFSGRHSIIGLAVIVHAGEDDLTSQPAGNAGPRVACGVIGIAQR